jgi:CubicO group peptidase (beta-lactamase class C family)
MTRRSIPRLLLLAAATLAVLVAGGLTASGIPRTAAGMAAKGVCSAAFVAHRPAAGLMAQDVLPASAVLRLIDVSIDEPARRVSARFAGLFERQAQWLPQRGCVLDVPAGPARPTPAVVVTPADTRAPWPQGEAALPSDLWGPGVDGRALTLLVDSAFQGAGDPQGANARGVAVIHKGRALVLRTAPGFAIDTPLHGWSMTKTVLGMLSYKLASNTGLAFAQPVVDAVAGPLPPAWQAAWRADARRNIRVSDLLFMRDGLDSQEEYQPWGSVPRMLWGATDVAAFSAASDADATPGTRWRYLSQTANLLSAVARTRFASDAEYWAYPSQALFNPIGARTAVLETDTAGNWVGSSYLWASVGDWARLGQLMLQDGRWNGEAVLPPGWLGLAATPATPGSEGLGYGAQTWRIGDPQQGRCRASGIPADTLAMSGHWGQVVAMVPSRDAVIVRLGWTFRGGQFDRCAFVASVLKALPP